MPGMGGTATASCWLPVLDVLTPAASGSSGSTADGWLLGGGGGLMSLQQHTTNRKQRRVTFQELLCRSI